MSVSTPDFLDWLGERLVHVYGESPNVDFVLRLKRVAEDARRAEAFRSMDEMVAADPRVVPCGPKVMRIINDVLAKASD